MMQTCDGVDQIGLCRERVNCQYYQNYLQQFVSREKKFNQVKKYIGKNKKCAKKINIL